MNLSGGRSLGVLFCLTLATASAADWPQWRGPNRTGHVDGEAPALSSLSKDPKVLWRLEIGGGFSSPVVAGGKLVYLDTQEGKEVAHLLDAQTGKELWKAAFADMFEDEWGPGPRSTPIMDGERVYVQSCNGEFRCLSLADGKVIWRANFEKDFGVTFVGRRANEGTATRRGNNGSGVIDGERVFVPVGSTHGASLVCFDKRNGKVLWKSQDDEAAYSSLMVGTLAGVKQVVYLSAEALLGVEPATGRLLWRVPLRTEAKRHAATPILFGDSVIVNSHTFGLACIKVTKAAEGLQAGAAWKNPEMKINISTPVLMEHFLYSQGPGKNFVCVDALTGRLMWSQEGFGDRYGSTIALGRDLLALTDRGELVLLAADSGQCRELGRTQVCGKTWNHPAYADGKLYVREGLTSGWKLTCFDLPGALTP